MATEDYIVSPSDPAANRYVGGGQSNHAISSDGTRFIVGTSAGKAVYIYDWNGSSWDETKRTRTDTGYGAAVAISGQGDTYFASSYDSSSIGSIWVNTWSGSSWTTNSFITNESLALDSKFGYTLDTDYYGSVLITSSPTTSKTYIYTKNFAGTWQLAAEY